MKWFGPSPTLGGHTYWDFIWTADIDPRSSWYILTRRGMPDKFWVSPEKEGDRDDIGPFDTFEDAERCFMTVMHK